MLSSRTALYWESVIGDVYPGNVFTVDGVPFPQAGRDDRSAHFTFSAASQLNSIRDVELQVKLVGQRSPIEESLGQGILAVVDEVVDPLLRAYQEAVRTATVSKMRLAGVLGMPSSPATTDNRWHRVCLRSDIPREQLQTRVHGFTSAQELLVLIREIRWRTGKLSI